MDYLKDIAKTLVSKESIISLLIIDLNYNVLMFNDKLNKIIGNISIKKGDSFYKLIDFYGEEVNEAIKKSFSGEYSEVEHKGILNDRFFDSVIQPLRDENNNIYGVYIASRDIIKKEARPLYNEEDMKKQKEIMYISYHDSLTGLYNRRYYKENLSKLDISENYPLTIVISDINGLKLINDAFGNGAGDKLLVSAANIISDSCRKTDLVARIGGDEFIIVMPNTNRIEAEKIIDKINKETKKITVESIELSISFGFETKNEINEDINKIYKSAEDLMYRIKLIETPSKGSGTIETILNTLYEKDKSSEIHSRVVSNISEKIALAYGMDRQDVNEVKTAGLLHDIGKIIVPISILTKKGKLTSEEYNLIKKHSEIGFRILKSAYEMKNIMNIVLNHHERWDGLGYPRGIKAAEIPLQSRIIAIADTFDAMTSKRTYGKIHTNEQALAEIVRCSGTQFDPKLVQVFVDNFNTIIKTK